MTIILYAHGVLRPAVMLQNSGDRIRIAIRGERETLEAHRVQDQWLLENGEVVECRNWMDVDEEGSLGQPSSRRAYSAAHGLAASGPTPDYQ